MAALRVSGAVWFVPVVLGIQTLVLFGTPVERGYTHASYAQSVQGVLYPAGPLLAGVAAAHFHRFREFHAGAPRVRRAVVLRAFGPLLFGSAAVLMVALVLRVGRLPEDTRTWVVLALAGAVVLACGAWGIASAWALPVSAAVPVAAALPFVWIAYLPALVSPVAHQLTPDIPCCAIDRQVSGTYLTGMLLLTCIMTFVLLGALSGRNWALVPRPVAAAVTAGGVVLAVGAALLVVHLPAGRPTMEIDEPRSVQPPCDDGSGVRICLWPEQSGDVPVVREAVAALDAAVRDIDLPPAGTVSVTPAANDESLLLRNSTVTFRGQVHADMLVAAGHVSRAAGCAHGLRGEETADLLVGALVVRARGELAAGTVLDGVREAASGRAALPATEFTRWFAAATATIGCAP